MLTDINQYKQYKPILTNINEYSLQFKYAFVKIGYID